MPRLKDLCVTNYLKQMISKYAKNPELFFLNGSVNSKHIDSLISKLLTTDPEIRNGKVCIKGTRVAVCDIIIDTWSLAKPKGYESNAYGPLPHEGIDAAFAFFMSNPAIVEENYRAMSGGECLPKVLYS